MMAIAALKDQFRTRLEEFFSSQEPFNDAAIKAKIPYGTAGFRGPAEQIRHLFYKVGIVSGLRCLTIDANFTGLMVTASHNPVQDNGVKLVDSDGEMLNSAWEQVVEDFCNLQTLDEIIASFEEILQDHHISLSEKLGLPRRVIIGYDTRPSSKELVALAKEGLRALSPHVDFVDYGEVTTPILHYLVAESNKYHLDYPIPIEKYYDKLSSGLEDIFKDNKVCKNYKPEQLVVDCANGVGYPAIKRLSQEPGVSEHLPMELINTGDGILNLSCGADFVKTSGKPPINSNKLDKRYASMDGDADRIIYFYLSRSTKGDDYDLNLIDGDKIMSLYAVYLKDLLEESGLRSKLTLGVVQTAYANGSSTEYLSKTLGTGVEFVDTGVKNLHKKTSEFDLGIYFEANGHGTIWISPRAQVLIEESPDSVAPVKKLRQLLRILINYTGDAISNILVAETILRHYDWSPADWYSMYTDRPSALIKVQVDNKDCITTTNAGMTCLTPENLQTEIDKLVSSYGSRARSFVRPSGTENVVRIYAEAEEQQVADDLAAKVGALVIRMCNMH